MKFSVINFVTTSVVILLLVFLPNLVSARHVTSKHSHHEHHHTTTLVGREGMKKWEKSRINASFGVAGSALPDCSHACGSCRPCRLVMVSFVCASIEEAESCPVAYRCMCKNKSYPVP